MVKIRFETGQVVNFDGNPTQADIDEVAQKLNLSGTKPTTSVGENIAMGVAKGELSTIKETGGLLQGMGQSILAGISTGAKKLLGQDTTFAKEKEKVQATTGFKTLQRGTVEEQRAKEFVTPKGTAQEIGFGAEKVAEFLLPATKIQKAQSAVDIMVAGSKLSPLAGATTKVLAKAGIEALGTGGVALAQTGDFKEAGKTALFAGGLKTLTGATGEIAKATKFPQKLYSKIFKESADDAISAIDAEMRAGLKVTNPVKYNDYVAKGIIDPVTNKVNETLAKEALDRGLKGSITNMTKKTVENTWDLEDQARNLVAGQKVKVSSSGKLANVLKEVAKDWKNVEDGSMSKEATKYIKLLQKGKIDGTDALKLRRFLDGMRVKSSFNLNTKLSQSQSNFKYWADKMRAELAKIPGVAETMKDYSFNIEALMALGKEAARQNNRQVLGMIDSLFIGSGVVSGVPLAGAALATGRKALTSATVRTNLAQAIQKSGVSTKAGIAAKGLIGEKF